MISRTEQIQMCLTNWYNLDRFEGSHNIATPLPLVNEILEQVSPDQKSMLVLFNVEWVIAALYERGGDPKNITFYSDHPNKARFVEAMGVRVINNLMDMKQKFDIIVGNPPFGDGTFNGLLYTKFFKKSLDLADQVAMIMPVCMTLVSPRMKKHIALIKKHMISLTDTLDDHFSVGTKNIKCVIASKNVDNGTVSLDSDIPVLYPERDRMIFKRGSNDIMYERNFDDNGIMCPKTVNKNGVVWKPVRSDIVNAARKNTYLETPWMVIVSSVSAGGKINAEAVKNTGEFAWASKLWAVPALSEDDANEIVKWLKSDVIQEAAKNHLNEKGNWVMSSQFINTIPEHH